MGALLNVEVDYYLDRYWIASAMSEAEMSGFAPRSAIVRATLRVRMYARAERLSLLIA